MVTLKEVKEGYETAEEIAKEVEQFYGSAVAPAINELRYAGSDLLTALNDDGSAVDESGFEKARNHCNRAAYDAAEAGIFRAITEIREFQEEYKRAVVSRVVSDYAKITQLPRKAEAALAKGRRKRTSVKGHTAEYMELFREMRGAIETLRGSRDDLNAMIEENVREDRRFAVRTIIMAAGALGAAAGGASALLAWLTRD